MVERVHLPRSRYAAASAALITALTLIVCLNDLGHFNTDIKPEVYLQPGRMIERYLASWTSSPYLGSANFNVGLVPVLMVLAVLRWVGLSPEWTFKIFHLLLWLTAAWGANRLTRTVVPTATRWVGLAAGVAYLANPYTIVAGNTLAVALPMALLPWLLLCYVKALRTVRGWGWPAAFGLTFFAMSGMNVAVIPLLQLLALIPVAVVARQRHHLSWRAIGAVTGKCALFVLGVSLYWLVPAVSAMTLGTQVVDQSETLTGIHKVSSLTEVLRGLGLWPMYGRSDAGPWVWQNSIYLTSAYAIALTTLWPLLALSALTRVSAGVRRALALTIGVATAVMIGLFPGENRAESPLGWLMQALFSIPALAAFRTTNKVGAVLALSFAIALALMLPSLIGWVRSRPGLPPVALGASLLVVGAWIIPALTNGLYISRMDVPGYWRQAAAAADSGNPNSTTLLLPGQTRPSYRWSVQRPDDVTNSLLTRDAVIPETSPNASAAGGNFLAALDDAVQRGGVTGDVVSTYARYLGADNILLRHDVAWEGDGGARPGVTTSLLNQDRGLYGLANFGRPGQNVNSPAMKDASYAELMLPPLQLFGVKDSTTSVRAQSAENRVVVAGDGWSFAQLQDAGLLKNNPLVQYAQGMNAAGVLDAVRTGGTLVLTDTNARRNVISQRLTANTGSLLAADEKLGSTRTLGNNSQDQTVLLRSGTVVTASSVGGTFFDMPYAAAENAFDGDLSTAWRFGDFGRARGQHITFQLPAQQTLTSVPIVQANTGSVKIDKVTVTAGGRSETVRLPDEGAARVNLHGVKAAEVTIRIDSVRGEGYNLVGLAEVGLPGPKANRFARTPQTLTNLYRTLTPQQRKQFESAPFDVLLSRVSNTPNPVDDSEKQLRRVISMPVTKQMTASANVRVTGQDLQSFYDRAAGYTSAVQATSSGHYFDQPEERASQAADNSTTTGWMPAAPYVGAWWQISGPRRTLNTVKVTQTSADGKTHRTQWASAVRFTVDGHEVARSALKENGTTTVPLPHAVSARQLRMEIVKTSGPKSAPPARFTSIDTGWTMRTSEPGRLDEPGKARCMAVATLDGRSIMMRPTQAKAANETEPGTRWESCEDVQVNAGEARLEQADGFLIDNLRFHADGTRPAAQAVEKPSFTVTKNGPTEKRLTLHQANGSTALVAGQSFDPRWHATLNGKDLGPASTLDGFSTGWLIPAGETGQVVMTFQPQRYATGALVVSGLVLVLAAVLAGRMLWRARRRAGEHAAEADDVSGSTRWSGPTAASGTAPSELTMRLVLVLVATFGFGLGGLIGALIVIVARTRRMAARTTVRVGLGLIALAVALFVLLNDALGDVSADAISAHLTPHRMAAAGLVTVLAAAVLPTHIAPVRQVRGRHHSSAHASARTKESRSS